VGQSATGKPRWSSRPAGNPATIIRWIKKKINPIVVVEAVETGEIDGYPCAYRRFPRERPGEGGYPVGEIGSFSTVSRAWGKVMAVIGRFQPPVFLL
jgi:hypothetical protein